MLFSFDFPNDSVRTKHPVTGKDIPTRLGRHDCRPRDLLGWGSSGELTPYWSNRGAREGMKPFVAGTTVKSVREYFNPWAYAGAIACQINDNLRRKYPNLPKDAKLLIADGHSGLMGLHLRWCDGNLTDKELDSVTGLMVAPADEFLSIYALRNVESPHTVGQALGNPDLAYGNPIWKRLAPKLNEDGAALILGRPAKYLPPISYIMESWPNRDNWDYVSVFHARTEVKKKRTLPADQIRLSLKEADYQLLADAINWYAKFLDELEERVGQGVATSQLKAIKTSGPFFCLLAVDYLSARTSVLPKTRRVGTVAGRVAKYIGDLPEMAKGITHGSDHDMRKNIRNISKLLAK